MMKMRRTGMNFFCLIAAAVLLCGMSLTSCRKTGPDNFPDRINNVLLIYTAAKNDLASYIETNIRQMCKGDIPEGNESNILLVYEKYSLSYMPTSSQLVRIYRSGGQVVRETVETYGGDMIAAEASTMKAVLEDVREHFPAEGGYGLLFTSHANGWLPKGYYSNPGLYDNSVEMSYRRADTARQSYSSPEWVPYVERTQDPSMPAVKSIGNERGILNGVSVSYEMDLTEFAGAIPMHLDYIIFDCCLMGGIEVAYELKDKCSRIIFSPTEILSAGYCYETLASRLLSGSEPYLEGFCMDTFDKFDQQTGYNRSCTISMVDCTMLKPLAEACRTIFSNHRKEVDALKGSGIQKYFRMTDHWFYDLRDIAANAGADEDELAQLDAALEGCVIYKAATPSFLSIPINRYSGLSSYLPGNGSDYLDRCYRSLAWNDASGLVQ